MTKVRKENGSETLNTKFLLNINHVDIVICFMHVIK
jgi:hypothetical protein